MVDRYQKRFAYLASQGKKAFIPFTMLGWPNKAVCLESIKIMIECGVSALELGIAFSDPVADGPLIQQAASETIASGFGLDDAFEMLSQIRNLDQEIPIGLLVYYNSILSRGPETFFKQARAAGVDGILVADATPDVEHDFIQGNRLAHICVVTPATDKQRLDEILPYSSGFLYAVSRLGITGVEERYHPRLKEIISSVSARTQLPLCVGFGISTPDQAKTMLELGAHGVVTGSRVIEIISGDQTEDLETELGNFLSSMLQVCNWRNHKNCFPGIQNSGEEKVNVGR